MHTAIATGFIAGLTTYCPMEQNSFDLPFILSVRRHVDPRGWFSESYHEARWLEAGINCRFVQENQSYSKLSKTLRGMHFQLPPSGQAKLVSVLHGRILDVAVDIRNGSPTFGRHVSVELTAESGRQMYIPLGFAHGFLTLENDVKVMYKTSNYYAPASEGGIRWNDPIVAIPWPARDVDIILSEKDKRLPLLKSFSSPFQYDGNPLGPLLTREL